MSIPIFLRRENAKPPKLEDIEMMELCKKYKEVFGNYPMTEPSSYTTQEWIDMLNKCLEQHITVWELWREEYNPEADY